MEKKFKLVYTVFGKGMQVIRDLSKAEVLEKTKELMENPEPTRELNHLYIELERFKHV
jgi:hypothetical protein